MSLTIIDPCDGTTLIVPPYSHLLIWQNGSTQSSILTEFTPSLASCIPITYSVTYNTVNGVADSTWFTFASDTVTLDVLEVNYLLQSSTVDLVLTGTSAWATAAASFQVTITNQCIDSKITPPSLKDVVFVQTGDA